MTNLKKLIAPLSICAWGLALEACASAQASEAFEWDVEHFEALRVERNRVTLSATIRNSGDRAVCIPNDMLPFGVHNSDILIVVDEADRQIELTPGYPLPGPERFVVLPPGLEMPIRPVIGEQYRLFAGQRYEITLRVVGYFCNQILDTDPPYPIPGHPVGGLDQVVFQSETITVELP